MNSDMINGSAKPREALHSEKTLEKNNLENINTSQLLKRCQKMNKEAMNDNWLFKPLVQ